MTQNLEYVWIIALSLYFGHKMFGNRTSTRWRPILVMRKPGPRKRHKCIVDVCMQGSWTNPCIRGNRV